MRTLLLTLALLGCHQPTTRQPAPRARAPAAAPQTAAPAPPWFCFEEKRLLESPRVMSGCWRSLGMCSAVRDNYMTDTREEATVCAPHPGPAFCFTARGGRADGHVSCHRQREQCQFMRDDTVMARIADEVGQCHEFAE